MPTYRPITDTWILTRARLVGGIKYYGAYPGGFLHRARAMLGVQPDDAVLHVCGGMVRQYPYSGVGPNDRTLDLDPATTPDIVGDARDPYPQGFRAILADPPYSKPDAARYVPGAGAYPLPRQIVRRAFDALAVGGRVGILHTAMPRPPAESRLVAVITVLVGYDNVARLFTVYEKTQAKEQIMARSRRLQRYLDLGFIDEEEAAADPVAAERDADELAEMKRGDRVPRAIVPATPP